MELLIRIVDKGPDVDQSKRGDIIAICPDGWSWSQAELTNPDWRIVRAPILQSHAEALLMVPEFQTGAGRKRRREWGLDFTRFPDPSKFTGQRNGIIVLTRAQVQTASGRKP